ncbi:MAG: hypothetical protein IKI50_01690 [Clostridia bacterium]|nr:hypothetical protein [Clostridia bacterium]
MNALGKRHPLILLLFFAAAALPVWFFSSPVITLLSLAAVLPLTGREGKQFHLWMLLLLAAAVCVNGLVSHRGQTVLLFWNDHPLTAEALLYGLHAGAALVATLYWCRLFSRTMTADKWLYLLGSTLPKTALLLSGALRFFPLFAGQHKKIRLAQQGIGLYKENSLLDKIRAEAHVFSALITWGLENGVVTADSMQARGYGTGSCTRYAPVRFTRADAALLPMILLPSAAAAVPAATGALQTAWYPLFSGVPLGAGAWVAYAAYAAVLLLPYLLYGKEALQWKACLSRM